ncbi:hypothetical protein [Burkholderia anthina]|uniref:hypothetical protein n=1 Tax=Burkholderia anthina TaxID=179879 RepID=UPI001AA0278E|nr:hypothetical protein [Burkholderia anthina]QTD88914.1 hypothetical protein J4G50_13965 [Burkholderia anthina]
MKLSELIEKCGEDIAWQLLSDSIVGATRRQAGVEVKFITDQLDPSYLLFPERAERVGFVIWLPRKNLIELGILDA